jgi:hypothetical protein
LAARPGERSLMLNLGRSCEAQGDIDAARASYRDVFEHFRDEIAAIEYVNFVFRHDTADGVLAAVEAALPFLGDDYRRAFLASAAAAMLRENRRDEAAGLLQRVLVVGGQPGAGRAVIKALAEHYRQPELDAILVS